MEQIPTRPETTTIRPDPVPSSQILPISYVLPLATMRFMSPAASPCATPGLLDLFFKRR